MDDKERKKYLSEKLSEFIKTANPPIKFNESGYDRMKNWFNGWFNSPMKALFTIEPAKEGALLPTIKLNFKKSDYD